MAEGVERRLDRLEPTIPSNGGGVRWREALGLLEEASGCLGAVRGVLPSGHLVVVRAHLAVVRAAQAVIASKKAQYGFEEQQQRNRAAVQALRSCTAIERSSYVSSQAI